MAEKIAGCVILYNPGESVVDYAKTYFPELDLLIVIDNSLHQNFVLVEALKNLSNKILYKWLNSNEGIARALNIACEIAIENGCEWLLTMDQDSSFNDGGMAKMLSNIPNVQRMYPEVGIITPNHSVHSEARLKMYALRNVTALTEMNCVELRTTMTSGNLLNLNAYSAVGTFMEKLFIDHVDHEFCLRLRKNLYKIIQVNEVTLNHSLGDFEVKHFLGRSVKVSNHNPQRRYYITRNGLFVAMNYFSFDRILCFDILKNIFFFDLIKMLFFEESRLSKIKGIVKGIYHFVTKRYGKYEL